MHLCPRLGGNCNFEVGEGFGRWRLVLRNNSDVLEEYTPLLMCSLSFKLHVSSGLKYIWCTVSLLTKTRRQNTETPWHPILDFPLKPGAKINCEVKIARRSLTERVAQDRFGVQSPLRVVEWVTLLRFLFGV